MLALAFVAASAGTRADELNIGDQAPPLGVAKWVKGEKVDGFERGKLYVVEFWATWCGPCRTSIPHLTELQKQYKDVAFIGVSILEDDFDTVAPFVQKMGAKMDYRVAVDDVPKGKSANEGRMAQAWMDASGEQGIPTAFVVNKDGKIAWIGHPMALDEPLEQIVKGSWDVEKAAGERKQIIEKERKKNVLMNKLNKTKNEDAAKYLPEIDALMAEDEEAAQLFMARKLYILLATDEPKAIKYAETLAEKQFADAPEMLNNLAWSLIDPEQRPKPSADAAKSALNIATKACEMTDHNDATLLDTLALAYFRSGDAKKALETQEKAMKIAADDNLKQELKTRLEQYRNAVKGDQ